MSENPTAHGGLSSTQVSASGVLRVFLRKSGSWHLRVRGLAGLGTQRATESKRHGAKTSDRGVRAGRVTKSCSRSRRASRGARGAGPTCCCCCLDVSAETTARFLSRQTAARQSCTRLPSPRPASQLLRFLSAFPNGRPAPGLPLGEQGEGAIPETWTPAPGAPDGRTLPL